MSNREKFENFLESLKGKGQDDLIESVKTGFQVCLEMSDEEIKTTLYQAFDEKHLNLIKQQHAIERRIYIEDPKPTREEMADLRQDLLDIEYEKTKLFDTFPFSKEQLAGKYKELTESLEHTIDDYYYDSKVGKYYDKSRDIYVEPGEVQGRLDAQQRSNMVNNEVLKQAFKLSLIDGKDYQKNLGRFNWDERMSQKMHRNAELKGVSVVELFEKAKEKFSK